MEAAASGWRALAWRRIKTYWRFKPLATLIFMATFFAGYFLLLRHPLFPVQAMPVTALDRLIGFRPWTLGLYVSLWVYVQLPPTLLHSRRELAAFLISAGGMSLAGFAVFLFWPTATPAAGVDWTAHPVFGPLKTLDTTSNALPSLHVSFAVFSAVVAADLLRQIGAPRALDALNWLWCAGILYSTLATKQHVAVDLLAGVALGAAAAALHLWIADESLA